MAAAAGQPTSSRIRGSVLPARMPARRRLRPAPASRPAGRDRRRRGAHRSRSLIGRTAHAVTHLPESGAVVGISRSRLWIAVIGVILIGIVGINLVTVSYGSMASRFETQIQELEQRNSILRSSEAAATSMPRIRNAALDAGMAVPATDEIRYRSFAPGDFAAAAQRLAADGG